MTSKAYTQRGYLAPPAQDSRDAPLEYGDKVKRRRTTVYDAVAGRVNTRGSTLRAHFNTSLKPLSAQQVLFQRTGAPTIYAEKIDEYNYSTHATSGSIPDSDLLKALHTYASDFYARMPDPRVRQRKRNGEDEGFEAMKARLKKCRDFRSMDESALLAMGVLMEEMMRESLGETGDLAFTEEGEKWRRSRKRRPKVTTIVIPDDEEAEADDEEEEETQVDVESQVEPEAEAQADDEDTQPEKEKRKKRKSKRKSSGRNSKRGKT